MEILNLKSIITKIKISLEEFNSKLTEEKNINKLKGKSVEILQPKWQTEKEQRKMNRLTEKYGTTLSAPM